SGRAITVIFEHAAHSCADFRLAAADQVTDHADIAGVRELDEHDDVWRRVGERAVDRVPDALPAVDAAGRLDRGPLRGERPASVADPLRSPAPDAAVGAALHAELVGARAFPVRPLEAVPRRHGARQALG